jgi:transposase
MGNRKKSSSKTHNVGGGLGAIRPLVAGVDIGSKEHWVCGPARPDGEHGVRSFGTTTAQLEALVQWLADQGVQSVAMESTSVYWIPLYELLESRGIEAVLVNARQLHNVPGRKTDVLDCQWLQTLHSHGLLRGSFRPSEAITRLRALQRQQANFVEQRTRYVQWMQKSLDQMNVQVHRAVSDLAGATGLAIVRAIVAGERDPMRLAAFRDHRCHKSQAQIAEHLRGTWRHEHLFNLAAALELFDAVERTIASYDRRLQQELEALQPPERCDQPVPPHPKAAKEKGLRSGDKQPLRTTLWRLAGADLTRIDGIGVEAARLVLTEVGTNLSAFPTEKHFVSWLRLCPRVAISGGKELKKRRNAVSATRVAHLLRNSAVTLGRSHTALGAAFRRIARHKGATTAVLATARKLAQLIYRMLRHGHDYTDIGEAAYEAQFRARRLAGLQGAASELGFALVPAATGAVG